MHAMTIKREKFLTSKDAKAAYDWWNSKERSHPYARVYKRELVGNEIYTYRYEEVYPYELDGMFDQQMNSMDNKLATGASKRRGRNGYDPGLTDYDEEDDEY